MKIFATFVVFVVVISSAGLSAQERRSTRVPDLITGDPDQELLPYNTVSAEVRGGVVQALVLEDEGTIRIDHNTECAESRQSGTEEFVTLEGRLQLPRYANAATIYQNGWRVRYLNKDHHVAQIQSELG